MKHIDLVGTRKWLFLASGGSALIALILLATLGLRPGIEFTSGTTMLVAFDRGVSQDDLRDVYASLGHPEARIQSTGQNQYLIRTEQLEIPDGALSEVAPPGSGEGAAIGPRPLEDLGSVVIGVEGATGTVDILGAGEPGACTTGEVIGTVPAGTEAQVAEIEQCPTGGSLYRVLAGDVFGYIASENTHDFQAPPEASPITQNAGERTEIEQRLFDEFGTFEVREFASVSAVVSEAAVRNAALAVVIASLFIMAYIAFAFSSLPQPLRYGICALVSLVHDVIIVLGAFSLFGALFGIEINLMFITALLTVIGFSVHDTIVVFDRIRENIRHAPNASLHENVNSALLQTFARSLNTSITVLLTVAAMLLLGGVTIREFLLVILVGVISGTYSSIGIAAQLLVAWEEGDFDRLFRRRRARSPEASPRA